MNLANPQVPTRTGKRPTTYRHRYSPLTHPQIKGSRRPKVQNLHDVFVNIADDEAEHVKTMASCQDPQVNVGSK